VSSAQAYSGKAATARIRFGSWAEFTRFINQDGNSRGLFVRASLPPPIGTELNVQFVLPDASDLVLSGRVVHRLSAEEARATESTAGMGVQFTHMSVEQAERVSALMAFATAQEPASGAREIVEPPPPTVPQPQPQLPSQPVRPRVSQPAGRDRRLDQVIELLERARFDAAERLSEELISDCPDLSAARILRLVTQARRARSKFEFEQAIELYTSVLMINAHHEEALDQLRTLPKLLEQTEQLYKRVFGKS
jgi:Tfp pilus assembly protein PilZ